MNRAETVLDSRGLLLRRVEFGESDLVLSFFTERLGRISALARGARRSRKRFGGSLEPFFTLALRLQPPGRGELFTLVEASIVQARTRLLSDLNGMNAAGRALSWLRRAAPAHTPEPALWEMIEALLEKLADPQSSGGAEGELAVAGMRLLSALGFAPELGRCVRCGTPCPPERSGSLDVPSGGLVCRACGGGRKRLSASVRQELMAAMRGEMLTVPLTHEALTQALDLIEGVLAHHAGVEG
ncbi:MAG TPA: DNA repair protein RecO [Polyangiaceae bacterium]|nr:DNA repair protein RecO [Polyangiaceae bacterium]